MSLQYVHNDVGQTTAVLIPIDDWNRIKNKYPDLDSFDEELSHWQKNILDQRRELTKNSSELILMDDFLKENERMDDETI